MKIFILLLTAFYLNPSPARTDSQWGERRLEKAIIHHYGQTFNEIEKLTVPEIKQRIAEEDWNTEKIQENINIFWQAFAENSSIVNKVSHKVFFSMTEWKPKTGTFYKDLFKTYPYKVTQEIDIDFNFPHESTQAILGFNNFRLRLNMSSGPSLFALDNLGFSLASIQLNMDFGIDSLSLLKEENIANKYNDYCGKLSSDLSSLSEFHELEILVCNIIDEIGNHDDFNDLVAAVEPKLDQLEKKIESSLKIASQNLGEAIADNFNNKFAKPFGFLINASINLLSSYTIKAKKCNVRPVTFPKCSSPYFVMGLKAQPIFGEGETRLKISKNKISFSLEGEAVPYALNFVNNNDGEKNALVLFYAIVKGIELMDEEYVRSMGKEVGTGLDDEVFYNY